MKNTKSLNKQSGFFDFGASLLLLTLFGATATVITPEYSGKTYAEQEVEIDFISGSEYADSEASINVALLQK